MVIAVAKLFPSGLHGNRFLVLESRHLPNFWLPHPCMLQKLTQYQVTNGIFCNTGQHVFKCHVRAASCQNLNSPEPSVGHRNQPFTKVLTSCMGLVVLPFLSPPKCIPTSVEFQKSAGVNCKYPYPTSSSANKHPIDHVLLLAIIRNKPLEPSGFIFPPSRHSPTTR